jgi:hypothetical protein
MEPAEVVMRAHVIDPSSSDWAWFLRHVEHDFYHEPSYVALCAAQEDGTPRAVHVTDGRSAMLLPLVVRPIPGGGLDATSPYGYPGPLVAGVQTGAWLASALDASVVELGLAGIVTLFVRLHPILNRSLPEGMETLVTHGDTVSIDLTATDEEQWSRTRLNHRRDISRAIRAGYVVRMDEEWQRFGAFKDAYRETMARRNAAQSYQFDNDYFDGLREALDSRLHLCVVERQGQLAAGGLFVETDGIVEYHLSGTSSEFVGASPLKVMLHFVRGWAKRRGNRVLHLGGGVGSAEDSLLRFKLGFSPIRHPFSTLRVVIDEQEYRRLVTIHGGGLDPRSRTGFFPAYRSPG